MFKDLLPSFAFELEKLSRAAPDYAAKVEEHHQAPTKDWAAFERGLRARGFQKAVLQHPASDEKLKRYAQALGDYKSSRSVVGVVGSRTKAKIYTIKRLPGGRLGCGCRDWQYRHSHAGTDCDHILELRQGMEKTSDILADQEILRQAREARERIRPIIARERDGLLRRFGFKDAHPAGSMSSGMNLPGEMSDIDFNVPVRNVAAVSRRLERMGLPKTKDNGTYVTHTYKTPEGVDVDVKLRPAHEVEYVRRGLARMAELPEAERNRMILEKYRLKNSQDKGAYDRWKVETYSRFGVIPPGGSWADMRAIKAVLKEKVSTAKRSIPSKCMYCSQPPTKGLLWAEGRGIIYVCDGHEAKAQHQIEVKNHDEVLTVRKVKTAAMAALLHVARGAGLNRMIGRSRQQYEKGKAMQENVQRLRAGAPMHALGGH